MRRSISTRLRKVKSTWLSSCARARPNLATADLAITTPPTGTLRVSILDAGTGKPTPAAAGVFAPDSEIIVPADALAFDQGGFYYQAGRTRPHGQSHYWPGKPKEQRAFFVKGEFCVRVPAGTYRSLHPRAPSTFPSTRAWR